MRFITVTPNPAIDMSYTVARFRTGEVHRAERVQVSAGGKGVNVARVLKVLGGDVTAIGIAGCADGGRFLSLCAAEGLNAEFVTLADAETRLAIVVVDPVDHRQTVVNESGPKIDSARLDELSAMLRRLVRSGDMVVFSGSLPPGLAEAGYARLIDEMKTAGASTLLDTSGAPLQQGIAARPRILKVNREEAGALGAVIGEWRRDAPDAAGALRARGAAEIVALTGSADGAVAAAEGRVYLAEMPQLVVVNAVGSGDAFAAGLVYSLANAPDDVATALRLACACGGASALNMGAGVCSAEQIEELSGRIKIEVVR